MMIGLDILLVLTSNISAVAESLLVVAVCALFWGVLLKLLFPHFSTLDYTPFPTIPSLRQYAHVRFVSSPSAATILGMFQCPVSLHLGPVR